MKITADFTRLHSGENLARGLKFTVDGEFIGKKAKIGFITPRGHIYFTEELSYTDGEGEYIIPAFLADGRGVLHCQLFVWDGEGLLGKSAITEIPVYPSVDDIDCPAISEETKKSLALIFEYLEGKSDKGHVHDDRYYTRKQLDSLLAGTELGEHDHDGRYYTREQISAFLDGKSDKEHSHPHNHDDRYYSQEELDSLLHGKSDTGHNHNNSYYTKSTVDSMLLSKVNADQLELKADASEVQALTEEFSRQLSEKSDEAHKHDQSYYPRGDVDSLLAGKADSAHNHDSRYYTESEINSMMSNVPSRDEFYNDLNLVLDSYAESLLEITTHTVRIPLFKDIDNSGFVGKLSDCADTWLAASVAGHVQYGSLSLDEKDYMAERLNPMLYSTRENNAFTGITRDILTEIKEGKRDSDGKGATVNCITLCNMLTMGIPFEGSRLCAHENAVGMSGYAFDICSYLDCMLDDNLEKIHFDENRNLFYLDNEKLDITTFQYILTQASFFETYGRYGLVKTVKSRSSASDGEIWYSDIRPGDVLWAGNITNGVWKGKHSLFCLAVSEDGSGNVTVSGVDASTAGNVGNFSFTVSSSGAISGISYDSIGMVARPCYFHCASSAVSSASSAEDSSDCKQTRGPYTGIAANGNLNKILKTGEYRCISASNVSSLSNRPSGLTDTFRLTVENITKDTAELDTNTVFLQTILTDKGEIFRRTVTTYGASKENPIFNPWYKARFDRYPAESIGSGADLNSYLTAGTYVCMTDANANSVKNCPAEITHAFRLTVENTLSTAQTLTANTYFTQRIRVINGTEFWRRIFYTNGAPDFGDWHKVRTETVSEVRV